MTRVRRFGGVVVVAVAMSVAPLGRADAQVKQLTVDCGAGQTITNAMKSVTLGKQAVITIKGTCTENVVVRLDDITFRGDPVVGGAVQAADATLATMLLNGARRIVIDTLTVSGGTGGVVGTRSASYDLTNSIVQNNTRFGVVASYGATGAVDGSQVRNNTGEGLVAANDASIVLTNSTVENNTGAGVSGIRNAHVRIGQDFGGSQVVRPVTIRNNGGNGVVISESSAGLVVGGTVEGNGVDGVVVVRASSGQIGIGSGGLVGPVTIRGNGSDGVVVFQASQGKVQGNLIENHPGAGIAVVGTSSATITGNTIRNNGREGIVVSEAATAKIGVVDGNNALSGNLIEGSGLDGVGVFQNSSVVAGGNTIQTSAVQGVNVGRSDLRLVGSNVIQLSAQNGVFIAQGTLFQSQGGFTGLPNVADTIRDNTGAGLNLFNTASADLRNASITGNDQRGIVLNLNSSIRIQNTTVSNNTGDGITLFSASMLVTPTPSSNLTVTGNSGAGIQCFGGENSIFGDFSGVTGNTGGQVVNCTGF